MDEVKKAYKAARNTVLQVPEIEKKVKEATSNEKWGPSGSQMKEIAQATHSYHELPIIMGVIWKRLNDPGKYWRHVYKSLLLIDYLIRNGSEQVIRECRANIIQIQTLTEFQHIDETDKDVGLSVRERAKLIGELLHDEKRMKAEREKAKANSKKFTGMGSDTPSWERGSDSYDRSEDRSYGRSDSFERSSSNRRDESDGEEEEEERPAPRAEPTKVRPRAPSVDKAPAQAPTQARNLFDFDDTAGPTPQRNSAVDIFSAPAPTQTANPGFANFGGNNAFGSGGSSGFGSGFGGSGGSSGFIDPFKQQPSNDFFDPRGNAKVAQPLQTNAFAPTQQASASVWSDFEGSAKETPAQEESQEPTSDDPWNKAKHLYDLDLTKKSSPAQGTAQKSTPMGAMGSPLVNPKAMGVPPQKTTPPSTIGTTTAQFGGFQGAQPLGMGAQPIGMGMQPMGGMGMQPMGMGMQPMGMGVQPMGGMGMQPMGMGMQPMGGMGRGVPPTGFGGQPTGGAGRGLGW